MASRHHLSDIHRTQLQKDIDDTPLLKTTFTVRGQVRSEKPEKARKPGCKESTVASAESSSKYQVKPITRLLRCRKGGVQAEVHVLKPGATDCSLQLLDRGLQDKVKVPEVDSTTQSPGTESCQTQQAAVEESQSSDKCVGQSSDTAKTSVYSSLSDALPRLKSNDSTVPVICLQRLGEAVPKQGYTMKKASSAAGGAVEKSGSRKASSRSGSPRKTPSSSPEKPPKPAAEEVTPKLNNIEKSPLRKSASAPAKARGTRSPKATAVEVLNHESGIKGGKQNSPLKVADKDAKEILSPKDKKVTKPFKSVIKVLKIANSPKRAGTSDTPASSAKARSKSPQKVDTLSSGRVRKKQPDSGSKEEVETQGKEGAAGKDIENRLAVPSVSVSPSSSGDTESGDTDNYSSPVSSQRTGTPDTLQVDPSSRSQKRTRSPSARFKEDMILFPWDFPRKKEFPRRTPRDKDVEKCDSVESVQVKSSASSGRKSGSAKQSSSSVSSDSKTPEGKAADSSVVGRVLNFREKTEMESPGSPQPSTSAEGSSSTSTGKLLGLSQLINKVSTSIKQHENDKLVTLFGHVEEPFIGDEEESASCSEDDECSDNSQGQDNEDELNTGEEQPDSSAEQNRSEEESTDIKVSKEDPGSCDKTDKLDRDSANESCSKTHDDLSTLDIAQGSFLKSPIKLSKEKVREALAMASPRQSPLRTMQETKEKCDTMPDSSTVTEVTLSCSETLPDESEEKSQEVKDMETDNKVASEAKSSGEDDKPRNIFDLFGINMPCRRKSRDESGGVEAEKDNSNLPSESQDMEIDSGTTDSRTEETPAMECADQNRETCAKVEDTKDVIVLSDEEDSDDKVIASTSSCSTQKKTSGAPSKIHIDRGGYSSLRASPRCRPKISTAQKIMQPQPIEVLRRVEKQVADKRCAFVSEDLDKYLERDKENKAARILENVTNPDQPDVKMLDTQALQAAEAAIARQVAVSEPVFDSVDGHLFVSFSSKEALSAHMEIEKHVDWVDPAYLTKVAQLQSLKDKAKELGTSRLIDEESQQDMKQNMRGVHKRFQKYQRLFRRELEMILKAKEIRVPVKLISRTPEKTSDITKIKGWKNKYATTEELQQATGLHFTEAGRLHWRTEERILKELNPDDVKEIGLDLKKKRRKLVHFTKRKGMSRADSKTPLKEEFEDIQERAQDDTGSEKQSESKLPYCMKYYSQHKYDKRKRFVKKLGLSKEDEYILKKLGSQHFINRGAPDSMSTRTGDDDKLGRSRRGKSVLQITKLTQSMALAAVSALNKRMITKARGMDKQPAGRSVRGKAGGKVREEPEMEEAESAVVIKEEIDDPEYEEAGNQVKKSREMLMSLLKDPLLGAPSQKQRQEPESEERKSVAKVCDKPGCRYGCICHLCKFSEGVEDEGPVSKPLVCDKEYCKLGCICESIEREAEEPEVHCRKPSCMFGCLCKKKGKWEPGSSSLSSAIEDMLPQRAKRGRKSMLMGKKKSPAEEQTEEVESHKKARRKSEQVVMVDEEDWEPVSKKQRKQQNTSRYSNLPRRESTYRLAKNLDAISRKAMMVYESSEMYVEQKARKRRSPGASAVVIDDSSDAEEIDDDMVTCARTTSQELLLSKRSSKSKPEEVLKASSHPLTEKRPVISTVGQDSAVKVARTENRAAYTSTSTHDAGHKETAAERLGLIRKTVVPEERVPVEPEPDTATVKAETAWRTQMVCLKAKRQTTEAHAKPESEIKLLEIISNCQWEKDRTHMLSKISHMISKGFPPNQKVVWSGYELQFLPSASKPAAIPPELKSKLPNAMFSIRVRVTLKKEEASVIAEKQLEVADAEEIDQSLVDLTDEVTDKMSDAELERYYNLRIQKKLIDKIRFAEKFKEIIESEDKKGAITKHISVSKEGIEKALKRYKTQLWQAYTGASNMTLQQLKNAVLAAKSTGYTEKITDAIKVIESKVPNASPSPPAEVTVVSDSADSLPGSPPPPVQETNSSEDVDGEPVPSTSAPAGKPASSSVDKAMDIKTLSPSTMARIEANQGFIVTNHIVKSSSSVPSSPRSVSPVNPQVQESDSVSTSTSSSFVTTTSAVSSVSSAPVTVKSSSLPVSVTVSTATITTQSSTSAPVKTPQCSSATQSSVNQSEVLLIPMRDDRTGALNGGQVLSAKMTMGPTPEMTCIRPVVGGPITVPSTMVMPQPVMTPARSSHPVAIPVQHRMPLIFNPAPTSGAVRLGCPPQSGVPTGTVILQQPSPNPATVVFSGQPTMPTAAQAALIHPTSTSSPQVILTSVPSTTTVQTTVIFSAVPGSGPVTGGASEATVSLLTGEKHDNESKGFSEVPKDVKDSLKSMVEVVLSKDTCTEATKAADSSEESLCDTAGAVPPSTSATSASKAATEMTVMTDRGLVTVIDSSQHAVGEKPKQTIVTAQPNVPRYAKKSPAEAGTNIPVSVPVSAPSVSTANSTAAKSSESNVSVVVLRENTTQSIMTFPSQAKSLVSPNVVVLSQPNPTPPMVAAPVLSNAPMPGIALGQGQVAGGFQLPSTMALPQLQPGATPLLVKQQLDKRTPYRILSSQGPYGKPVLHLVPVTTAAQPPPAVLNNVSLSSNQDYIALPVNLPMSSSGSIDTVNKVVSSVGAHGSVISLGGSSLPLSNFASGSFIKLGGDSGAKKKTVKAGKAKDTESGETAGKQAQDEETTKVKKKKRKKKKKEPEVCESESKTESATSLNDSSKGWSVCKISQGNVVFEHSVSADPTDGNSSLNSSHKSVSSEGSAYNVKDLIQNTREAGRQIADKLGVVLDESGDHAPRGEAARTEQTGGVEKPVEINSDDSDDECLIIDETRKSPVKKQKIVTVKENSNHTDNVAKKVTSMGMDELRSDGKKRRLVTENGLEQTTKKVRSVSPCGSSITGDSGSDAQLNSDVNVVEDSGTSDVDVENIFVDDGQASIRASGGTPTPGRVHTVGGKRKMQYVGAAGSADMEFTEGVVVTKKKEDTVDGRDPSRHNDMERSRRQQLRDLYRALQGEVLKDQPSVKEMYVKPELPKVHILRETKMLVRRLQERFKMLETAKEVRLSSQKMLKKRLDELTASFVKSGVSEPILKNFLKSVAKAAVTKHAQPSTMFHPGRILANGGHLSPTEAKVRFGRKPKVEIYIDNPETDMDRWDSVVKSVPLMEVDSISAAVKEDVNFNGNTDELEDSEVNSTTGDDILDVGEWLSSDDDQASFNDTETQKNGNSEVGAFVNSVSSKCGPGMTLLDDNGASDVVVIDDPTRHVKPQEVIELDD